MAGFLDGLGGVLGGLGGALGGKGGGSNGMYGLAGLAFDKLLGGHGEPDSEPDSDADDMHGFDWKSLLMGRPSMQITPGQVQGQIGGEDVVGPMSMTPTGPRQGGLLRGLGTAMLDQTGIPQMAALGRGIGRRLRSY